MDIKTVGVVGCGLMGHGIVQVAAQGGFKVLAHDNYPGALEQGKKRIEESLTKLGEKAVEKGKLTPEKAAAMKEAALSRIEFAPDREGLVVCDLVIEAAIENLDLKKDLFADLGRLLPENTLLASNTSSFPILEMANASGRPEKTLGLHFFNPVQLMRLVEVVGTDKTDPEAIAAGHSFARSCGKTSINCKDTPGFVVNRLLVPFMVQALLMLERGDAAMDDIDTAMNLGCGHPMGPITLADYVGLDTSLFILEGWCESYPDEPAFRVPDILRQKVREGKLGRKTGEGFFRWEGDRKLES